MSKGKKLSDFDKTEYDSNILMIVNPPSKRYQYKPKKDITIHEVARLIPLLMYPTSIEHSESDLLRHFKEVK